MNMNSLVGEKFHGWPVGRYLAERFRYLDADGWVRFIRAGNVSRGDEILAADTLIQSGDIVSCLLPDVQEPPAILDYRIIHEDPWLLGVDKPGNLLVHRRGRNLTGNLIYQIRFCHSPSYPEANIVNRLDRCTSGIVLLARNRQTLSCMNEAFAMGEVNKTYLGIVHGVPHPRDGRIDFPIGRIQREGPPRFGTGENVIDKKEAQTDYRVVSLLGDRFAIVELRPRTGRTHQLRVHMEAIGHPLVGDPLYQGNNRAFPQTPAVFHRQALHCTTLRFRHPATGESVTITAALPRDMEELCRKLAG